MNRYRVAVIIGVALIVISRFVTPLVAQAQDESSDSVHDQLRIMTKILEASIGKDALDRHVQQSVFDSRIRSEYIPSVGAIFTIPISFPLHPTEDEKESGHDDVVEEDLWEHFSNTSENTSKTPVPPVPPMPPIERPDTVDIEIEIEGLDEQIVRKYKDAARTFLEDSRRELLYIPVNKRARDNYLLYVAGSSPYDSVKVSTLTRSIIQTIAHYGHRLKSLPNSERVLVVLEAPEKRDTELVQFRHLGYLASNTLAAPLPGETQNQVIQNIVVTEDDRSGRKGLSAKRSDSIRIRGSYWKTSDLGQGARDHRLLAFKKSDLQQERTYDSIKGKVETRDY